MAYINIYDVNGGMEFVGWVKRSNPMILKKYLKMPLLCF
jgi:hypothetical protein